MYTSLTAVGSSLVVCGGWDPGSKGSGGVFHDDIWRFCTDTGKWSRSACTADAPFSRHTAHAVRDGSSSLVLLHTFRCDDHVLLYDPERDTLRRQPTTGDGPKALSMQAGCTVLDGTKVVLVGGSTRTREMTSDVFVLDTATWAWRRFSDPAGPTPRASVMLVGSSDGEALFFGGAGVDAAYTGGSSLRPTSDLWKLRLRDEDVEWTRVKMDAEPPPRVAGIVARHGDARVVLHGGWDPRTPETLGDAWVMG
jgi:hypothetical protein